MDYSLLLGVEEIQEEDRFIQEYNEDNVEELDSGSIYKEENIEKWGRNSSL